MVSFKFDYDQPVIERIHALQLFFYGFSFIKSMVILLVQQFDENIKFKYDCWPETDPDSPKNTIHDRMPVILHPDTMASGWIRMCAIPSNCSPCIRRTPPT